MPEKKRDLVLPGCISPSEVAQAVKRGLKNCKNSSLQKQAGGVAMIKAMAAPYTGIKFYAYGWKLMQRIWRIISPLTRSYAVAEAGW